MKMIYVYLSFFSISAVVAVDTPIDEFSETDASIDEGPKTDSQRIVSDVGKFRYVFIHLKSLLKIKMIKKSPTLRRKKHKDPNERSGSLHAFKKCKN